MYPGRTRYGGVLALAVSGRSDRSRPRRSLRCGGGPAARRRGVRGTSAGGDAEAAARSTFPAFAAVAVTGDRLDRRGARRARMHGPGPTRPAATGGRNTHFSPAEGVARTSTRHRGHARPDPFGLG